MGNTACAFTPMALASTRTLTSTASAGSPNGVRRQRQCSRRDVSRKLAIDADVPTDTSAVPPSRAARVSRTVSVP